MDEYNGYMHLGVGAGGLASAPLVSLENRPTGTNPEGQPREGTDDFQGFFFEEKQCRILMLSPGW